MCSLIRGPFRLLNAERDQGAKDQRKTTYIFMCIERAREHGITILDYPLGRTLDGAYIDIPAGFHIRIYRERRLSLSWLKRGL